MFNSVNTLTFRYLHKQKAFEQNTNYPLANKFEHVRRARGQGNGGPCLVRTHIQRMVRDPFRVRSHIHGGGISVPVVGANASWVMITLDPLPATSLAGDK